MRGDCSVESGPEAKHTRKKREGDHEPWPEGRRRRGRGREAEGRAPPNGKGPTRGLGPLRKSRAARPLGIGSPGSADLLATPARPRRSPRSPGLGSWGLQGGVRPRPPVPRAAISLRPPLSWARRS